MLHMESFISILLKLILSLLVVGSCVSIEKSTYNTDRSSEESIIQIDYNNSIDDIDVSLDFLHFYDFIDGEKILPIYIAISLEWPTDAIFDENQLIDHDKWLPLLKKPNLYLESYGAKNLIDVKNNNQYLIYRDKQLIYLTRLNFKLKCKINGPTYPHETKICHLFINSAFGSENKFKLNWKNLTTSQKYLPGFLIYLAHNDDCYNENQLIELNADCLHVVIALRRFLGVQLYLYYVTTVIFALISYSNFYLPIVAFTARFVIISIPLVAILMNYQNVPETASYTYIDYWFIFYFFYVISMFIFLCIALKEFADEIVGPNQYIQALMADKEQAEKMDRAMAFSNWKQHLKEQIEQHNSVLVSVSNLKTDQLARHLYPFIMAVFNLIYVLQVYGLK